MADGGVPLDADGDGEVDGAGEADLRQGQQDGHQVGVPADTPDPGHQYSAVDIRAWNESSRIWSCSIKTARPLYDLFSVGNLILCLLTAGCTQFWIVSSILIDS